MKVSIKTYGCTLNQADSMLMGNVLADAGYEVAYEGKLDGLGVAQNSKDIVIINTCAVKKPTEQKILYELQKLSNAGAKVVATGCLASADQSLIRKYAPSVSIVTTPNIAMLPKALQLVSSGKKVVFDTYARNNRLEFFKPNNSVIAKIPLSDGCLSNCSFCETKFARGPLNSFPEEMILEAIRLSVARGAKEIDLTAQDTGAYGADRNTDIVELLDKARRIEGDFMMRVGMLNPQFLDRYAKALAVLLNDRHIYKFAHIPVQSGSNNVLKAMRRLYTMESVYAHIDELRAAVPYITIETDIIVGFPTETEEDFNETLEFMKKVKPEVVNISKFGAMPHAEASKMKQLGTETINERSAELSRLARKLQAEANNRFIGSTQDIIITEANEGSFCGRASNYKQVIVGSTERVELGGRYLVKIEKATANALYGKVVQ
ncbi:MAG: tRNA (N(6)-L-threonylcarbamoyladenosine(37)-C(2))-methylthiotransferase [Candidatus Marsarchaeota archaeon]|jgi:MiaB-like tRNA modifying enzyme|nr:tRNA (N(6)-L-threonylcarbamoyladenosine(37)-C(2))-methylthiotransferase [Candidatus Marsarchaeota archaeon]MCL5419046.1 tRNA (N(6)-L-threonylcarbamoyladenosine(37)-C(2))-methylthiotransferase [Candidatus Marsarchaeota archaeon]